MPWQSMQDDLNIPNIKQGDNLQITDAKLAERRTVAPPYLSESDLIGLMEKNGIGKLTILFKYFYLNLI